MLARSTSPTTRRSPCSDWRSAAGLQGDSERSTALLLECRDTARLIPDRRLAELVRAWFRSISQSSPALMATSIWPPSKSPICCAARVPRTISKARSSPWAIWATSPATAPTGRERFPCIGMRSRSVGISPIKRVLIEVIESVAIVAAHTRPLRAQRDPARRRRQACASAPACATGNRKAVAHWHGHRGDAARRSGNERFTATWELGRALSADRVFAAALEVEAHVRHRPRFC